jgi:hypothetical protein
MSSFLETSFFDSFTSGTSVLTATLGASTFALATFSSVFALGFSTFSSASF